MSSPSARPVAPTPSASSPQRSRVGIRPSRTRFVVLAFLGGLAFVLYLDRVCIAQAVKPIQDELHISDTRMGLVLMAFTLAYGLFELPTGHWGDRIGARAVLTRIALWWSVFTALTAAATGFWSLLAMRFLFGAGEAGAYPNVARIISHWFPASERGRIQGAVNTAALLGGAAAPVVAAYLIRAVGWRWSFVIFGAAGVVWAVAYWLWFRDDPARHPAVNEAERDLIGPPDEVGHRHSLPWRAVFRNRTVWLLGAIMALASFNAYFYFSWFPKYLQVARGVEAIESGWLSSLVLAGAALGTLLGGLIADALAQHAPDLTHGRRMLGSSAFFLSTAALSVGVLCESPRATAFFAALSCLAFTLTIATWWACASAISTRHLGALFGLMNGLGGFGAMASQFFVGVFVDWRRDLGYSGREQWDPAFVVYVSVLALAAMCWSLYAPQRLEGEEYSRDR